MWEPEQSGWANSATPEDKITMFKEAREFLGWGAMLFDNKMEYYNVRIRGKVIKRRKREQAKREKAEKKEAELEEKKKKKGKKFKRFDRPPPSVESEAYNDDDDNDDNDINNVNDNNDNDDTMKTVDSFSVGEQVCLVDSADSIIAYGIINDPEPAMKEMLSHDSEK